MPTPPGAFVGITSLLGGDAALGAVRFINADPERLLTSALVIPGLHKVSSEMLRRSDHSDWVCRMLSPGGRQDKRALVGLQASGAYRYIGLQSGTTAPVRNALAEGWLNRKLNPKADIAVGDSQLFCDSQKLGTETVVTNVEIKGSKPGEVLSCADGEKGLTRATGLIQAATLGGLAYMVWARSIPGALLTGAYMLSSLAICYTAVKDKYTTPAAQPSPGVLPGHAIVADKNGNSLCVVRANEDVVQEFLQKPIGINEEANRRRAAERKEAEQGGGSHTKAGVAWWENLDKVLEYGSPVAGWTVSVASILVVPLMKPRVQAVFAAQLVLGLLAGMLFSSRDGDEMLERMADANYPTDTLVKCRYTNRTTALAAAVMHTQGQSVQIGDLLPKTDKAGNYRPFFALLDDVVPLGPADLQGLAAVNNVEDAVHHMCVRFPDSAGQLYPAGGAEGYRTSIQQLASSTGNNPDRFRIRLIVDVIEALMEKNNMSPGFKRNTASEPRAYI